MDYNDITARLNRILAALNTRVDHDYERHAKVEFIGESVEITLPAKDTKSDLEHKVMSILHALAAAKDHLKNNLKRHGKNAKSVELFIDTSLHLQVLIDIVNADKHNYPTNTNRSKLNPQVTNIRQGLVNNNNGQPIVMSVSPHGDLKTLKGTPPSVQIFADIIDEKGHYIFDLDNLVETCFSQWVDIATQNGFLV